MMISCLAPRSKNILHSISVGFAILLQLHGKHSQSGTILGQHHSSTLVTGWIDITFIKRKAVFLLYFVNATFFVLGRTLDVVWVSVGVSGGTARKSFSVCVLQRINGSVSKFSRKGLAKATRFVTQPNATHPGKTKGSRKKGGGPNVSWIRTLT